MIFKLAIPSHEDEIFSHIEANNRKKSPNDGLTMIEKKTKIPVCILTVKFLNFRTPEIFAYYTLNSNKEAKSLRVFVKMVQME